MPNRDQIQNIINGGFQVHNIRQSGETVQITLVDPTGVAPLVEVDAEDFEFSIECARARQKELDGKFSHILVKRSRNIFSYGYDVESRTLEVRFKDTDGEAIREYVYRYYGVEPEAFAAFEAADSIGSHLNSQVRPKHKYERINRFQVLKTENLTLVSSLQEEPANV